MIEEQKDYGLLQGDPLNQDLQILQEIIRAIYRNYEYYQRRYEQEAGQRYKWTEGGE